MRVLQVIIGKELKTAFYSWFTYIIFILSLGIIGFRIWLSYANIFNVGEVSLSSLFYTLSLSLFFTIPFFTMKSISEELRTGTFELLTSKPVSLWDIIGGKFMANIILVALFLLLTLIHYITIASLSHIDYAVVLCGYLGLILLGGCYVSIGLFASSLTHQPIVALVIHFCIAIWFQFIFQIGADFGGDGHVATFLNYLSLGEHFNTLSRGIIDSRSLVYLFSVSMLFLALTHYRVRQPKH